MPDAHPGGPAATVAGPAGNPPEPAPVVRPLCNVRELTGHESLPSGALWKLAEAGRQLDANVIHLPAGQVVETHAEPDLDVLLMVVAGHGTMDTAERTEQLTGGALMWMPHGSSRRITASDEGLSYFTVHRRRPGMQIRSRSEARD